MRTFLCAVCILLLLLGAVIAVTREVITLTDRMIALTLALPPVGAADCEEAVASVLLLWQHLKPFANLSAAGRTVEQIDQFTTALEVCANREAAENFELNRRLLIETLHNLRMLMGIGWNAIF